MKNEWKPIKGYEGLYEVNRIGQVKSLDRYTVDSIGRKKFYPGKPLTALINEGGYSYVKLSRSGQKKQFYIHRLVALAFINNPNNLEEVNHIDGNKKNNVCNNLEWITSHGNELHAIENNLKVHGSNHYESKLDENKVRYIRKEKQNKSFNALAKELGVTVSAIFSAYHGLTWKHVK